MIEPASPGAPRNTPSTADYVEFHAAHRPQAVALVDDGIEISYARFHLDLQRFTRALAAFGLPRGSLVAVAGGFPYVHWLLLLACENLGIASASFLPGEGPDTLLPLFARADLVVSTRDVPAETGARFHKLTKAWVDGVLASDAPAQGGAIAESVVGPTEALRVRRSSGTTGGLKMMVVTRQMEEYWMQNIISSAGFTQRSRFLINSQFTVGSMYCRATACLRLGTTCIHDTRLDAVRAIARHRLTHVRFFQFAVTRLLDGMDADFVKPPDLTVILGAAPLSDALRERILKRLATSIVYTYNSNETNSIAVIGADGVGTLRPGVRAETVDEHDAPVPAGRIGRVRVRTPDMVDGYFENPEATARMFRDGWFYTGDAGIMTGPRRLKIVGRSDELLNIGGLKISPAELEERFARSPGIRDIGVTSMANADDIDEIVVALVPENDADLGEIRMHLARSVDRGFGRLHILPVAEIPRTETGKILRGQLRSLFARK